MTERYIAFFPIGTVARSIAGDVWFGVRKVRIMRTQMLKRSSLLAG